MFRHTQFLHQRDVHTIIIHQNVRLFIIYIIAIILIDWWMDFSCDFRPTPQVKHYHIKQNTKLEFFLSEKHCCLSIAELVNYHRSVFIV